MYYNRKRAHSTLGYLSPFEYKKQEVYYKNLSFKAKELKNETIWFNAEISSFLQAVIGD